MDLANSIAAYSMSMSAMQFQQDYSVSMMKKAMDTQETAAQELLDMLPAVSSSLGQHIDVYA